MNTILVRIIIITLSVVVSACGSGAVPQVSIDSDSDSNTITDSSTFAISSVSPGDGETGVEPSALITVTFSKAADSTTLSSETFYMNYDVTGVVSYDSATYTATLTPSEELDQDTTYTVTVTAGVADAEDTYLAVAYTWSFTTSEAASLTVDYATEVQSIFDVSCVSGCHEPAGSDSSLDLSYDVSYDNLVNQNSEQTTDGGLLVEPYNAADSVLYQRVSGEGLFYSDALMPPARIGFGESEYSIIETWINEGAAPSAP